LYKYLYMNTVKYSELRQNLKTYLQKTHNDEEPILVVDNDVYLVSKSYLDSLEETLYLMSTEANRKHLKKSVEQIEKGETLSFQNISELDAYIRNQAK